MAVKKSAAYARFDELTPLYGVRLMQDVGVRDFHAAAILGNAGQESGGMSLLQELKPTSGRGGYGWFQWTGSRRVAFEKWCRDANLAQDGEAANYGFLLVEMKGAEAHALRNLKLTTTLEAATETFALLYERPGVLALANRVKWANRALPLIRRAAMQTDRPGTVEEPTPAPVLPPKLPEPTVTPPRAPEKPDSAWETGMANMRKVFGPAPRRSA